jgi:hypothetical protein
MAFQIFISYARKDDLPFPPDSDEANGFVTVLVKHLKYQFQLLGGTAPELWRDTRAIKQSDQFDPILQKEVAASDFLLVVLSRNWVEREWCRHELELFEKRWHAEGEQGVKSRIVVVAKHLIEPQDRPALLQGQEGYTFYRRDGEEAAGQEQEFFRRGKPQEEYHDRVEELARDLWGRAHQAGDKHAAAAGNDKKPSAASTARTIYLAKPAADMRAAYLRLVDELQGRGYAVAPEPSADIPSDASATAFVDAALAGSEASIHLLGEKGGYAPEDTAPIVKLQLERAAKRVADDSAVANAKSQTFRRIVWAPKVVVEQDGTTQSDVERDPLAVLAKFDSQLPTDKIDGSEISKFSEFVVQHLNQNAPPAEVLDTIDSDARVYVYHRPEDTDYALQFGRALQERKIEPVFPAFEGDPVELTAWHREKLRECNAVVVCWANAAEVWARSRFPEFRNWHELGREKKFDVRALVAGPPPGQRKTVLVELPPRNEIDVVLDLTGEEKPTPASLDPLISAARSNDPGLAAQ